MKWTAVRRRKPPNNVPVILAAEGEGRTFVVKGERDGKRYYVEDNKTLPMWLHIGQAKITHWMPWPAHPSDKSVRQRREEVCLPVHLHERREHVMSQLREAKREFIRACGVRSITMKTPFFTRIWPRVFEAWKREQRKRK